MGAWSTEPFGNDIAVDWAYRLTETNHFAQIEEAFEAVEAGEGYLDADEASEAVAAAEALAHALGCATQLDAYTEDVAHWAQRAGEPSDELRTRAVAVLGRILGEESELDELWEEVGAVTHAEWRTSIGELIAAMED